MTLFERIQMAWDIITSSKLATRKPRTQVVSLIQDPYAGDQPQYPETNFENMVKFGWRKNELIFATLAKKANTASQVQMVVESETGDVIENHPLKSLLQKPNSRFSESTLWASVVIFTHLAGKAVYEKQRDYAGRVVALWPLRPDWLAPVPGRDELIDHYEYKPPGFMEPIILDREDVLEFPVFDPLNQFNGWPPVAVAGRVGDVDNSATDYVKLFFEKGGVPPLVIKTLQEIDESIAAEIREKWSARYGGAEAWVKPAILDRNASIEKVGFNFDEMGFEVLDARNEARICAVMDVPPILVNAKIGLDRSTYSNYAEARTAWWNDTLIPLYTGFIDVIENQLMPDFIDYGGAVKIRFDFSAVPALQEDTNARWSRAGAALQAGAITVNEFREVIGLDPVDVGDVFLRSSAISEISLDPAERQAEKEAADAAAAAQAALLSNDGGDDDSETSGTDTEGDSAGKSYKARGKSGTDKIGNNRKARKTQQERIERELAAYFQEQYGVILEDLSNDAGQYSQ